MPFPTSKIAKGGILMGENQREYINSPSTHIASTFINTHQHFTISNQHLHGEKHSIASLDSKLSLDTMRRAHNLIEAIYHIHNYCKLSLLVYHPYQLTNQAM
jgi:hypothetical protein